LYQHFSVTGHSINYLTIHPVEQIIFKNNVSDTYKFKARCMAELDWIKRLQTPYPLGLNDNIFNKGNISKNNNIDIFALFKQRRRKTRSHGRRINGNIKRKHRRILNMTQCHNILVNNGKHRLLNSLCSLSVPSLRLLDKEADSIVLRTNPMYECACIIQSYTKHYLSPSIDAVDSRKRYRIKLSYCNKGIDLLDINGLFKNKNVEKCIPQYFQNKEPPTICYKYKQPIRNLIFNYNKVVVDDDIHENTPASCDCLNSKYCYNNVGHIITGDFKFIQNNLLRKLLYKGPKYRIASEINFDTCRTELTQALTTYCANWCKRESVGKEALVPWLLKVSSLLEKKIEFFNKNPFALPPKSITITPKLINDIKSLHSKFVLVPADKAANNVIIV
jgi:hypothetical protein